MFRIRLLLKLRGFLLPLGVVVAATLVLLATIPVGSAQNTASAKDEEALSPPPAVINQAALPAPKEKVEAKKSNLDKTKDDAAALSALADQLRDELNKMNVNVFSLDVIQKTQEVEKLAKKLKAEAAKH